MMNLNCSDASALKKLLTQILQQLETTNSTSPPSEDHENDNAYLYIVVIMIFYGVLAGALILAYTRSRKQESKSDPYHLYIESEWVKHRLSTRSAMQSHQRESIESENLL